MNSLIELYRDFLRWTADNMTDEQIKRDPNFLEFVAACIKFMKKEMEE